MVPDLETLSLGLVLARDAVDAASNVKPYFLLARLSLVDFPELKGSRSFHSQFTQVKSTLTVMLLTIKNYLNSDMYDDNAPSQPPNTKLYHHSNTHQRFNA